MKITIQSLQSLLNKVTFTQVAVILVLSAIYLTINNITVFTALVISAFATALYTQLLKLSSYSKYFVLYGFPVRLLVVAIPTAILVHKLKSNLLALFVGLVIGQVIYFIFIWKFSQSQNN